jgi:hypothetical protein
MMDGYSKKSQFIIFNGSKANPHQEGAAHPIKSQGSISPKPQALSELGGF